MPTYDYECATCGGFEAVRRIAQRDDPWTCPQCAAPAPRVLVGAARLAHMSGATRQAMDTNERARHAPRSSQDGGYPRMSRPTGCGCCAPRRGASSTAPNGAKTFPSQRPWMISH